MPMSSSSLDESVYSRRSRRMSPLGKKFSRMRRHMRTLMSGRFHDWRPRAGELWTGLNGRAASHSDFLAVTRRHASLRMPLRQSLLRAHFSCSGLWAGRPANRSSGSFTSRLRCLLRTVEPPQRSSPLSSRCCWLVSSSAVPMSTALLFGLEGLLIGLVVLRMAKAIQALRRSLEEFRSGPRIS